MKTLVRISLCILILSLVLVTSAAAQSTPTVVPESLPDTFFYTIVDGGKLETFFNLPTSLGVDTAAWWQASAKFVALKRTNPAFRVDYDQAVADIKALHFPPDISPEQFRSPSKEKRDVIRRFLVAETNRIMTQRGVFSALASEPVPYDVYQGVLDELQADLRQPTHQSNPETLFHYCPGADQNVSVDRKNKNFILLATMRDNEEFNRRYRTALASFMKHLTEHPNETADQLNMSLIDALRKEGVFRVFVLADNRADNQSVSGKSGGSVQ